VIGRRGDIFFTPEDRAAGEPAHEMSLARSKGRAANERWHLRKDGSRFWGSGVMLPLADHRRGFLKIFRDRTQERAHEEAQKLLIDELNHRVKNTLATVQAIAAQTLRNAGVDSSVQRSLEARLLTLSNVHNVLTHENWDSAELRDVVWAALRPHCAPGREHFTVGGPDLRVRPQSAVALSMALHELCT